VDFSRVTAVIGRRLGVKLDHRSRRQALELADVVLDGRAIGRVYGNEMDGFIFQMIILKSDLVA
jgi:hypothetical protein